MGGQEQPRVPSCLSNCFGSVVVRRIRLGHRGVVFAIQIIAAVLIYRKSAVLARFGERAERGLMLVVITQTVSSIVQTVELDLAGGAEILFLASIRAGAVRAGEAPIVGDPVRSASSAWLQRRELTMASAGVALDAVCISSSTLVHAGGNNLAAILTGVVIAGPGSVKLRCQQNESNQLHFSPRR